jgi:hypothetical protein
MSSGPLPIPDFMKILSKNIQTTFQELVKALLRRSVIAGNRAPINRADSKPIKNLINWYNYSMTYESIGWTGDIFATLRITPRTMGSAGRTPDCNGVLQFNEKILPIPPLSMIKRQVPVSRCSCSTTSISRYPQDILSRYENFILLLSGQNANHGLTLQSATNSYTVKIPYTVVFKKLELIGEDIINQTDVDNSDLPVTTLALQQALSELELVLTRMSNETPVLYKSYLELLQIVNLLSEKNLVEFLRLIVVLSYQRWGDLPEEKRNYYISVLSPSFIERLLNNELATLLIQSDNSQLIVTTAYLYPLLKMLFCVFGYSRLEPFIVDRLLPVVPLAQKLSTKTTIRAPIMARKRCCTLNPTITERYGRSPVVASWNGQPYRPYRRDDYAYPAVPGAERWQSRGPVRERDSGLDFPLYPRELPRTIPEQEREPVVSRQSNEDLDRAPYDPSLISFIGLFRDLYPTLLSICGGIESIPPSAIAVECDLIPTNYQNLTSIPEYLWRFNDYSFCQHSQLVDNRCDSSFRLDDKIDAKVRYLRKI